MKNFMVIKKLIELFGKINTMKILSIGGSLLSIISGLMTHSAQKKATDQLIKEEVERAIKEYMKQNGGVQ